MVGAKRRQVAAESLAEKAKRMMANPPKSDEPEASDDVWSAILRGRNQAPGELYAEGWRPERLGDVLALWSSAEWPCRALPRRVWLDWFRLVAPPVGTEPLEVWRAQRGRTIGLAWATTHDQAEWFHRRNVELFGLSDARMLHGIAPGPAVLWCGRNGRGESEAIIDPTNGKFWTVLP